MLCLDARRAPSQLGLGALLLKALEFLTKCDGQESYAPVDDSTSDYGFREPGRLFIDALQSH